MLPVSTENYEGGVWENISKTEVCACVDVERGCERKIRQNLNGVNLQFSISWIMLHVQMDIHL